MNRIKTNGTYMFLFITVCVVCSFAIVVLVHQTITMSDMVSMINVNLEPNRIDGTKNSIIPLNQALKDFRKMPLTVKESLRMILEARNNTRGTFLQIGANDGQLFDPLYPHMKNAKDKWIGLLVEPQPELYSRLCVLHADAPDWSFFHGAVANKTFCKNGTIQLCETKTPGVGDWKTQGQINRIEGIISRRCNSQTMHIQTRPCISSISDLIYNHATPVYLEHVMEKYYQEQGTITSIKRKYHVDFLQIDVEGGDYAVLQMVDWNVMHPVCIGYEHQSLDEKKKQAAKVMMKKLGYTYTETTMDVLACRVSRQ